MASDEGGRPVVTDIVETSDAYRRGLRRDDEIVSFAGRPISTANAFKNILGILPKGWRVPLSYRREGKQYDVLVRLAAAHSEDELIEMAGGRAPDQPMPIPKPGEKPKKPLPPGKDGKKPREEAASRAAARRTAPAGGRQEALRRETRLRQLLLQHLEPRAGLEGVERAGEPRRRPLDAVGPAGERPLPPANQRRGRFADASLRRTTLGGGRQSCRRRWPRPSSGGLFPALYLWRRLATEGLARFGEVRYVGAAPLVGHAGLVDVLAGTHKGVECRFYFDPAEGDLLAIELFPDENSDPCEVYFSDYRQADGRLVPGSNRGPFRRQALRRVQDR